MAGPRSRDLTEGSVAGHLLALGLPTTILVGALMSVSLADAYFLARLGADELAAIAFCFPVTTTLMSIGIGLSAGSSSVVARAAGRKAHGRVRRLTEDAILLAMLALAVIAVAGWLTVEPLFRALGAQEELIPHIVGYMRIWYAGLIFMGGVIVINAILRALGEAKTPAMIVVGICLFNVALDPLLIFGVGPLPELGIRGAATASLVANFIAFCAFLWMLAGIKHGVALHRPSWAELKSSWAEIGRVGAPAAVSNAINPVGVTLATAVVAQFGAAAVAGFGVATRIETFALVPLLALSGCVGPLTGQNGGAGLDDRVRRSFAVSFVFAAAYGAIMAAALAAIAAPLTDLFSDNTETLHVARAYLWLVPVTAIGYGVVIAAAAGFNALGWPMQGLAMTLARSLVLYAPGAWIGGQIAGPVGAIVAIALANVVSGAGTVLWTLRFGPMRAHGAPA